MIGSSDEENESSDEELVLEETGSFETIEDNKSLAF